jgi:hypothetical protein
MGNTIKLDLKETGCEVVVEDTVQWLAVVNSDPSGSMKGEEVLTS